MHGYPLPAEDGPAQEYAPHQRLKCLEWLLQSAINPWTKRKTCLRHPRGHMPQGQALMAEDGPAQENAPHQQLKLSNASKMVAPKDLMPKSPGYKINPWLVSQFWAGVLLAVKHKQDLSLCMLMAVGFALAKMYAAVGGRLSEHKRGASHLLLEQLQAAHAQMHSGGRQRAFRYSRAARAASGSTSADA
eukprot:1160685-Pelagomonas_calceolata.AAC.5